VSVSVEASSLERRARRGVVLLGVRSVAVQLVVLVGNVQLYRLLSPAEFGTFAIVQFAIGVFALFGDAGLAAALIQKHAEPSPRELSSTWTLQLLVGVVALVVLAGAAPFVVAIWPNMPASSTAILRCLAFGFLLTMLRVVPTLLMERKLRFGRLAALEFVLTLGFYVPAVVLARQGMGALALGYAIVIQGVLGVVGAFALEPFRPRLGLEREVIAPVLRFGVAFQAKHVFGFALNAVLPIYAGAALGQAALGQLGWAQATGFFPVRLVQLIGRVGFPLFSRLQGDRGRFVRAVERSLHVCALGTFVFVALVFGIGAPLVRVIFTERWLPSLPLLYVYTGAISLGFITPVFMPVIDSMGKPRIGTWLSAFFMVLVWVLAPLGVWLDGTLGFALAYAAMVVIGNVAITVVVRRLLPELAVVSLLLPAALAALVTALVGRVVLTGWIDGPLRLVLSIAALIVVFAAAVLLFDRRALSDVRSLLQRAPS
jgi:PST family polysaccharide transporter